MFLEQSRNAIVAAYENVKKDLGTYMESVDRRIMELGDQEALAVKYLYATMPYSDIGNYPLDCFLDFVYHGVWLYEHRKAVRDLPESIFLQYVLYHRVNEEEIRPCRKEFYQQLEKQIDRGSSTETALEVNYWCAGEVAYQADDDRTLSALAVFNRGYGRCGEESVFTVNALRGVGIPARQVYVPYWSHCDDNHAWVEVWIDGQWHFMGACEPEPLLDLGWFEYAASRAMMVHARRFDRTVSGHLMEKADEGAGTEHVIGTEGIVLMENELSRYASQRKRVEITVLDQNLLPVKDAAVWFEVLNFAAFRPIAQCRTDEQGKVTLWTGSGSLHLFATAGQWYGEAVLDARKEICMTLCLSFSLESESGNDMTWEAFDMIAPNDHAPVSRRPDPAAKQDGQKRLKKLQKKQEEKRKTWTNPDRDAFLSWLNTRPEQEKKTGRKLLEVLSDKDQTDISYDVLVDHLEGSIEYRRYFPEKVFVGNILNPRVEDEILTDYRNWFQKNVDRRDQMIYRTNPEMLWNWIQKEIRECPERERSSVITTPKACFQMRCGSKRSKRVLFTAMARSFGIPARLCPEDGMAEYWKDGKYISVERGGEKNAVLIIHNGNREEWIYEQNWSVTRLTSDHDQPLRLQDGKWKKGEYILHVRPGTYRIVTAFRLPNGSIQAKKRNIKLSQGCKKNIVLESREGKLSEMLEALSLPEFQVLGENGEQHAVTELVKEGVRLLLWAGAGEEPTEHFFNEMLDENEKFSRWASGIAFFVRSEQDVRQPLFQRVLGTFPDIRVYYDDFQEHVPSVGRRLYVDYEKLPIIAVLNKEQKVIYGVSGYQVGTGNLILRILREQE